MTLDELCGEILIVPEAFQNAEITSVETDSRRAHAKALFVCLKGSRQDGHRFISDAVQKGCRMVLADEASRPFVEESCVCLLLHHDPKAILPVLLRRLYRQPDAQMRLIGVTGTNGKTTITYVIESIYQTAGRGCGVIGTVNYRFGGRSFPAKNTTPGIAENFYYLSQMRDAGMQACVMEVSSHALVQGRVEGITFEDAIFTNLTSDHLDYHQTQEEYFLAKALFFNGKTDVRHAMINRDDAFGLRLRQMTVAPAMTYGISNRADIMAENLEMNLAGSHFDLAASQGCVHISTSLLGKHNVYNILAAAGVCLRQGFSLNDIQQGIVQLKEVPGRLERIDQGQDFYVFVDYAHTEDALKNVLNSIREVAAARILVLFGCGGDRDKTKRAKMAAVVEQYADVVIVTNDNPRSEDPQAIAKDIERGFSGKDYEVILDREDAIRRILASASAGDCVLIAGKGHEDYQIFKDQTIHFDDREVCRSLLGEIR